MGDPESHEQLAKVLRETPATVVLSGYPSDLYDDLYAGWWHMDVPVMVHSSNATTVDRTGRIERIWSQEDLTHGRFDFSGERQPQEAT